MDRRRLLLMGLLAVAALLQAEQLAATMYHVDPAALRRAIAELPMERADWEGLFESGERGLGP